MSLKHLNWIVIGAALGLLGVVLGAFGAHGLKDILGEGKQLERWHTAVQYQLWHAPVLILLGIMQERRNGGDLAGWCLMLGSVVFSGTLYAMALGAPTWFGAITPIGGLLLILGWLRLMMLGRC